MRVVVTGAAGFLGAHLVHRLLARGDTVVGVDNLSTGRMDNLASLAAHPQFRFSLADVSESLDVEGEIDAVAHLASPASPVDYHRLPLETLAAGSRGTERALRLAERAGARFVLASTSEVYGDPLLHPQREDYWGNVNPIGPRSVYDEAKRFSEAMTSAYRRVHGTNTGIVRIFNTYGPLMRPDDGRVMSSFVVAALLGRPLTIHGDGSQTRSFCYADDLVRGLVTMLDSAEPGPINLGSEAEIAICELAQLVLESTGSRSVVEFSSLPEDDPVRRRPDLARARELLHWQPNIDIDEGVARTVRWFTDFATHTVLARGRRTFAPRPLDRMPIEVRRLAAVQPTSRASDGGR